MRRLWWQRLHDRHGLKCRANSSPTGEETAVVKHDVVPATKLFIYFKTKTSVVCPAVILNFGDEKGSALRIDYDREDNEVECIVVARRIVRRNEESERVASSRLSSGACRMVRSSGFAVA